MKKHFSFTSMLFRTTPKMLSIMQVTKSLNGYVESAKLNLYYRLLTVDVNKYLVLGYL
jgi:hypothetical protein